VRKKLYLLGNVLGVCGFLLLLGAGVWWAFSEELMAMYEHPRKKWVLFSSLAGLILLMGGIVLASVNQSAASSQGNEPGSKPSPSPIACKRCLASNDTHARFCNQCGAETLPSPGQQTS
jgi:hypothetical protein